MISIRHSPHRRAIPFVSFPEPSPHSCPSDRETAFRKQCYETGILKKDRRRESLRCPRSLGSSGGRGSPECLSVDQGILDPDQTEETCEERPEGHHGMGVPPCAEGGIHFSPPLTVIFRGRRGGEMRPGLVARRASHSARMSPCAVFPRRRIIHGETGALHRVFIIVPPRRLLFPTHIRAGASTYRQQVQAIPVV